jgi:hypothetical protein
MISFRRAIKRIMARIVLETRRVRKARQDRNREFITCLVYVSVIRKKILPVLMYLGKTGDL